MDLELSNEQKQIVESVRRFVRDEVVPLEADLEHARSASSPWPASSSWRSGAATSQPSFMAGYELQDGSEPLVRVGADRWEMFASDNEGFVESDRQEERLVDAMRRGSEMRVSATSARSTATNYTFSLFGISKALERVENACR